ncbi:LrgB-like family-domain-containing protein [Biscogniauxia marginata]|nr:LrgB-like family-domain-containing protein [Biscogniauxia marginata]
MIVEGGSVLKDIVSAIQLTFTLSWSHLVQAWLYVPTGIVVMLLACFGVDRLLQLGSVSFPASVACLLVLFLALLLSERVLGEHRTRRIVAVIEIPAGWCLRWMNVFFVPSFVQLPLSSPIGGIEVLKIIAVFVIGFVVMMAFTAYLTRGLQLLLGSSKKGLTARAEELGSENDEIPMTTTPGTPYPSSGTQTPSNREIPNLEPPPPVQDSSTSSSFLHGRHPHHHRQDDNDNRNPPRDSPSAPSHGDGVAHSRLPLPLPLPPQEPLPPSRAHRWAAVLTRHLDELTYGLAFLAAGLPAFYATGYALPRDLTFTVLAYFAALSLPPPRWRQYLHPTLLCALAAVLGLWGLGPASPLAATLGAYRTGTKYTSLWSPPSPAPSPTPTPTPRPGAGDVFASVLDASVVALALPMYQYRRELAGRLAAIAVPSMLVSAGSLFAYPWVCAAACGIGARRSLAFAARSVTLALAAPAVANLGGDADAAAALAIMSGVLGVLVGNRMLRWMGIPEDDYVTRGVTLGANSSAIATALLLRTDPRAAALSSLSMSLFGTITVLFTSIPPVVTVVRSLAGLS